MTTKRHQPPDWMREQVKNTYGLPRSYLTVIPAGQHPVVVPCSQWMCHHSLKENTAASMFLCILLERKHGQKERTSENTPKYRFVNNYFFNFETTCHTDIAAVWRTFSSLWYKQRKNTGTESDIASNINHKDVTSWKVNSYVLFLHLLRFPFKFCNICLKCILNFKKNQSRCPMYYFCYCHFSYWQVEKFFSFTFCSASILNNNG